MPHKTTQEAIFAMRCFWCGAAAFIELFKPSSSWPYLPHLTSSGTTNE